MDNTWLNVIIPVFNESTDVLTQTFASLERQTIKDFKIIVVDDGSKAETAQFCDNYFLEKEIDAVVLHQSNTGVSAARNFALTKANSQYIMFLDAGDWIEDDCLEIVHKKTEVDDFDLIGWNNFFNSKEGKQTKHISIQPASVIFEGDEQLNDLTLDMVSPYYDERYHHIFLGPVRGVWGKLYKTEIIKQNNIQFDTSLKIGEDAIFNIQYLKHVKKATFFNLYLNHYFIDTNSANRRCRSDIVEVRCNLINAYCHLFKDQNTIAFQTVITREILSAVVSSLKRYICNQKSKLSSSEKKKLIKNLLNRTEISQITNLDYDKRFFSAKEKALLYLVKKQKASALMLAGGII
jgi:glycosyltransferase involved in cell wall biosynthesis